MFKTEQSATPKCKQCGKPMEFAAEITPLGSRDGVRFFQCNACHTTHDQTIPARKNTPRNEKDLMPRSGFIRPCLPTSAPHPPSGELWLHEIKHDGFRCIARKDGKRVNLSGRAGNNLTKRFPLIVEVVSRLESRSCIIDGEAVACGDDGIALFDRIRHRHHDESS